MFKSVLAVSEGGPDAAMSFGLARRVATVFDGTVDALHLAVGSGAGPLGFDFTSKDELASRAGRSRSSTGTDIMLPAERIRSVGASVTG